MKVELIGTMCISDRCAYRKECANHETAGDFRYEDGFTPEIEKQGGELVCLTADREMWDDPDAYGDYPINYNELGRGYFTETDLERKTCADFQI